MSNPSRDSKGGGDYTSELYGTYSRGNHYYSRDYGPSAPSQNHYVHWTRDGSYHGSNPNRFTYESNGFGGGIYTSPTGQQNNACTKVASKSDTTCTPPSKKSGTTCTTVRSESHQTSVYPDGETHHAHTKYSVLVRSKQS